jgi:hypothetical protein
MKNYKRGHIIADSLFVLLLLCCLALVVVFIVLIISHFGSILNRVGSYTRPAISELLIHIGQQRSQYPDALFWGLYGVYIAILLFELAALKDFQVCDARENWFLAIISGVALIVIPLVLILYPEHLLYYWRANGQVKSMELHCGSWYQPSKYAQHCYLEYRWWSGWAVVVMGIGVIVPLFIMAAHIQKPPLLSDEKMGGHITPRCARKW